MGTLVRGRSAASVLSAVARNPNLRRLEQAFGGSMTADWAFTVALAVFAYRHGGATAVGVVGLVRTLPAALVTPFAAAIADRYERERVLLAVSVVASAALAAAAGAYSLGADAAVIFVLGAVESVAATLFRPVSLALMPSLATAPEEIVAANAGFAIVEGLGTFAGPLIAGVLVAKTTPGVVFAACGALYGCSALAVALIRVEARLHLPMDERPLGRRALLGGFRLIGRNREVRVLTGLFVAQTAVRGALGVLIVVAAFRLLHAGSGWVGFMSAAIGAGGLVGGLAATRLAGRPLAVPFALGLLCWGVPLVLVAAAPQRLPVLLLLVTVGIGNALEDVSGFTLLQRLVSDDVLARVQGAFFGLVMAAVGLGAIVAPALVAGLGARAAFVATGALVPLLVAMSWHRLRRIDEVAGAPAAALARLQAVPMFASLPVAAKEHVASRLVQINVPAGTRIIQEGERADCFYLLLGGRVTVTRGGRTIPFDGPYFGEIALLNDSPRTASVTAAEESDLYVLERDDFLAAVTGSPRTRDAADSVVAERLAAYERAPAG